MLLRISVPNHHLLHSRLLLETHVQHKGQVQHLRRVFTEKTIVIGQQPPAHFILPASDIAPMHAVIKVSGQQVVIIDLASESGIRVNNQRVKEGQLHTGDHIQLGHTTIVITIVENTETPSLQEESTSTQTHVLADEQEDTVFDQALADEREGTELLTRVSQRMQVHAQQKPATALHMADNQAPSLPDLAYLIHHVRYASDGFPHILWAEGPPLAKPTSRKVVQVAIFWGNDLIDVAHFPYGQAVTIGTHSSCCLHLPWPTQSAHTAHKNALITYQSTEQSRSAQELHIHSTATQRVKRHRPSDREDTLLTGTTHMLQWEDRLFLNDGPYTLVIEWLQPRRIKRTPLLTRLTQYYQTKEHQLIFKSTWLVLATMGILAVGAWFSAPPHANEEDDLKKHRTMIAQFYTQKEQDKTIRQNKARQENDKTGHAATTRKKSVAQPIDKEPTDKDPKHTDTTAAHSQTQMKKIMNSGVLGALERNKNSALAQVFNENQLSQNYNEALSHLKTDTSTPQATQGALGLRSMGNGQGGMAAVDGKVMNSSGTRAQGGLGSAQYQEEERHAVAGRGQKKEQVIKNGPVSIQGGLAREVIERVINQQRVRLRYCYEKELQKNPDLYGKATIKFTIGATGSVIDCNVLDSTLNNTAVEACLNQVFQRMVFPTPEGGSLVEVSYPIIFSQSGGG